MCFAKQTIGPKQIGLAVLKDQPGPISAFLSSVWPIRPSPVTGQANHPACHKKQAWTNSRVHQ
jgi:hypothetical protein